MFKKVLIANRGEIAVRIIRACKEWGINTVAVHSDVDAESMHVRLADESVCIGSHQPQNSYLNISSLMSAVDLTGAEAIHPGYGFLSENAKFAEVVTKHGIKFVGPSADLIKKMGDKIQAKKIAKQNGLPIIEGSDGSVKNYEEAKSLCKEIGYPILIKASAGGGGKGMKVVEEENNLKNLFLTAKNEAKKYFGNDELYEIVQSKEDIKS
jgi:acetyl-CoA carboxylase biotin carboxylase subunit